MQADLSLIRHEFVRVNGVQFHCAVLGEGPLLLLLHGFPECWYSWRFQMAPLASTGFRVVAPDLRGYNQSYKPRSGYDITTLTEDIRALIEHYGDGSAVVAGHDWGGALTWVTAMRWPEAVRKLVALNLPHPTLFARGLLTNPRQMIRSGYILFFQIPFLPEWLFRRNDFAAWEQAVRGTMVHPENLQPHDVRVYKEAMAQPGALTSMLNYYRCLAPGKLMQWARGGPETRVGVPTLLIWGERDLALGQELTFGTVEHVPDLTIRYIPDASHWVQQDAPDAVNQAIAEFLQR